MGNLKRKKLIIITISIVILIAITAIVYAGVEITKSSILGQSFKEKVLDKKSNDRVIATVNKEDIKESEVAYLKWQYDNAPDGKKPFPESENINEFIIKRIAKNKLLIAEAKKYNINLSENEKQQIIKSVKDSFDKNPEENQALIDNTGLSKDDISNILEDNQINSIIQARFISQKIIPSILKGEFHTNDKNFQKVIDDFQASKLNNNSNVSIKTVLDAYYESLYSNAEIKFYN